MNRGIVCCATGLVLLAACESNGDGSVRVRISGEGPAKTGYPYPDGEDVVEFVDGWSLTYSKVLVAISSFELRSRGGAVGVAPTDGVIADLHLGDPIAWEIDGVGARRWERLSYEIVPPTEASRSLESVLEEDAARMRAESLAVLVEGIATDGDESIPFSIGIHDPVRAYDCENGVDGTEGLVVPVNGVGEAELTIHLDHFFLDSIAAAEPSMRFEPFAALVGSDGILTLEDLVSTPVTDIRDRDGEYIRVDGRVLVLDPGPFPLDATRSIASFVRANASTLGHYGGEGHCRYADALAP